MNIATQAAFLVTSALSLPAFASNWDVDGVHSRVGFSVRHLMISNVRGAFTKYTGALVIDDVDVTKSKVHLEIDAASITTTNDKRDEDLRSPLFFDVANYPKIEFDATKIERAGEGLNITGNLTIKGVTKSVVLSVSGLTKEIKDPFGSTRRAAVAQATINRKDFGLTWNKTIEGGGVVVGETVTIDLEVELKKKV